MRERMRSSPLMNQAAFTGHLESAFSAMWARWVATHWLSNVALGGRAVVWRSRFRRCHRWPVTVPL